MFISSHFYLHEQICKCIAFGTLKSILSLIPHSETFCIRIFRFTGDKGIIASAFFLKNYVYSSYAVLFKCSLVSINIHKCRVLRLVSLHFSTQQWRTQGFVKGGAYPMAEGQGGIANRYGSSLTILHTRVEGVTRASRRASRVDKVLSDRANGPTALITHSSASRARDLFWGSDVATYN